MHALPEAAVVRSIDGGSKLCRTLPRSIGQKPSTDEAQVEPTTAQFNPQNPAQTPDH